MRNLKSSSTVELVITFHLAFGQENQPSANGHYYIATAYNSAEIFLIPVSGAKRPVTQTLLVNTVLMISDEIKQFHPNISVRKSDLREGKDKL